METIELIRELIPLIEGAGQGAFWLVLVLLLRGYFIAAVVCATVVYIAYRFFTSMVYFTQRNTLVRAILGMNSNTPVSGESVYEAMSKLAERR